MIDEVVQRCAGEPELTLTFTPALKDAVVTQGYSATYGARPLRRAVRQHAQNGPCSQQAMRPPPVPEAHPPAQGCLLRPRGAPSLLGCRSEAAVALLRLPKVADLTTSVPPGPASDRRPSGRGGAIRSLQP
eukprot:scaffold1963_cov29-Phaeocystis_antarctica.AAC.2